MADQRIRLFFDESMAVAIAEQLTRRGIDSITVRDIERLGEDDRTLLQLATEDGRVMVTADADFKKIAQMETHIFFVSHSRKKSAMSSERWNGSRNLYGAHNEEPL